MLETTRGNYCGELAHVSGIKPYYVRNTILLELDHDSKTSESSKEDFATIARTSTFLPKHATPAKISTLAKSLTDAQLTPQTMKQPSITRVPIDIPQEAPQIPEATCNPKLDT